MHPTRVVGAACRVGFAPSLAFDTRRVLPMTAPTLQERFRGAIVGTAVGDALGAPFEGRRRVPAAALAAWQHDEGALRWTDDTAMTIGLAESLAALGRFDGADMADRFVTHHQAEPWRGYGGGPPQIFAAIRDRAPWHEPARELFGGQGSYGNGAAMRVAPAGLFAHRDLDAAVELARATAAITHAHELARQGAALQAYAVGWFVGQRPAAPVEVHGLLADLRAIAPAAELQRAIDVLASLEDLREEDRSAAAGVVVAEIGNGIAAAEAVPAALHAMLAHLRSFPDAVGYAIRLGGDTDTIAAMTGALSGAFLGHYAIPTAWLARLEDHDRLVALADELLAAATAHR